ncbi:hypothetical protein V3C99_019024, partial [Haemonchus contortus]|uniref:t-SNARE coiled-coil homology domain-containing protein n=1 Tax=Haemonchus contortus TaxID=6289 RepID=A0A7I5EDX3_HAECO
LSSSSLHRRPLTSYRCQLLREITPSMLPSKYVGAGKSTWPRIVHTPSKDQCEKKIGDVTGDGKLEERFFTIGESSVNSQDGINTGKERNNDATETMEQMNAGIFELVEQMKQMKRSMASGPYYIGKRIDEANYR